MDKAYLFHSEQPYFLLGVFILLVLINVFLHYYKDLWVKCKRKEFEKRIVRESTKDVLSLNRLIYEETRSTGPDYGKHGFLNNLKKVVQGTRTFMEAIKNHETY